jgi:hypothetical protein
MTAEEQRLVARIQALLELIESHGVMADATTKARLIERRDTLVAKARHDMRYPQTGRFYRLGDPDEPITQNDGIPITHSGVIHPDLKRALGR